VSTIGQRIKSSRKDKNLSLVKVSELTGLSTGNLSDLENDKFAPSANTLLLLKRTFGVNIDWLLTGNVPKDEQTSNIIRDTEGEYLTEEEKTLLEVFRKLSPFQREKLIGCVYLIFDKNSV
jgi:transcriptional regulator with XRE-family HTH domain